jgi:hypothetical protein
MANTNTAALELTLDNGKVIPLRQQVSKGGNTYWAALAARGDGSRYYSKYGVTVSAAVVGDKLPASCSILGETVALQSGTSDKGKAKVSGTAKVMVPGHGRKTLKFRITEVSEGTFNVDAIVNAGNVGGARALDTL